MSASPSPSPAPPIRSICKTPLSYFEAFLSLHNFTQIKCFGQILDRTIGDGRSLWCRIDWDQCAKTTRTSKAWCKEAVNSLTRSGFLRERYHNGHASRPEYAIATDLAAESSAKKIAGRCEACHKPAMFSTEFIPMPHSAFRELAAGLDHATYCCVMIVARFSHKWNGERGLWSEDYQLDLNDFERLTPLERRQVQAGLRTAAKLGLITITRREGRPSLYRTNPQNWPGVSERAERHITQPVEKEAKPEPGKELEKAHKSEKTHATESTQAPAPRYGLCPLCGHFGHVEALEDAAELKKEPSQQPPRAGPVREKKPDRTEEMWKVLKRWNNIS